MAEGRVFILVGRRRARRDGPHMPKMQLIDLKALMAPLMDIFASGEEVV